MIRAIIVDDEPLAVRKIRGLLKTESDVHVVAECTRGDDAIAAIEEHNPDLLFLDVQMPEVDGFDVLQAVEPSASPDVVFVTAHDRFAVRAFELHAIDYLLKPFARDRFRAALARARDRIARRSAGSDARIVALLNELRAARKVLDRIPVTVGKRTRFIQLKDVDWMESERNYVRLHTGRTSYLLRGTMKALEERLDPQRFIRVNRSLIVNLARVVEVIAAGGSAYTVVLADGTRLESGWGYGRRLRAMLENPL